MKKVIFSIVAICGGLIVTRKFLMFKEANKINKHDDKFFCKNTINLIAIGCIVNAISALIAFIF